MTKKKQRITLFPLFLFFITSTLIFSTIAPQISFSIEPPLALTTNESTASTIITLETETQNIKPHTDFYATITVQPGQDIAGVQCDFHYNPSLITVINVTRGNLFNGYDTYFIPGENNPSQGTLTGIAGVITSPDGYVNQEGTLATLHLKTLANQGLSSLELSNVIIGDPTADPVPVIVNNNSITITGEAEATLISISPQMQTAPLTGVHTFDIMVSPVTEIAGVQTTLAYDPASIEILNISQGTLFGSTTYFHNSEIDNLQGSIDSISSVTTTPGGTLLPGSLAHVTFKTMQEGSTTIHLTNTLIGDSEGNPVPHILQQGTITIGPTDSTPVTITPSHQEIMQGETVTVDIQIHPQDYVAGVQFDLTYDPSLLTPQFITQGTFFQGIDSYFSNGTIDDTQGIIHRVAGTILGDHSGTINPGSFARVTFTTKSITGDSPIGLTNVLLGDPDAQPLPVITTDGIIEVISASTSVSIIPQETFISPGDTFTLDIYVNPLEAISGVETDITFNPDLLTAIAVHEGDIFTDFNTYFNNGTIDNVNGAIEGIWGVIANVGGGSTALPGTFAQITFTTKMAQGSTPITISHALVGTPEATSIPLNIRHGTVTIGFSLTFPLKTGWNTLSLPFTEMFTAETLGNSIGVSDAIATWDPASQEYKIHPVGISGQDFPIEPGHGYLIHVYEDTQFTVTGNIIEDITVPITMGWNMLGWIHDTSITAEQFGETILGCDVVAKWDPETQDYTIHPQTTPINDFTIHQGDTLFIHATQDSTWYGE